VFHQWFYPGVNHWHSIFRFKTIKLIEGALERDTLNNIDPQNSMELKKDKLLEAGLMEYVAKGSQNMVYISSSALDSAGAFYEVTLKIMKGFFE